jgi:hypothetical protein
MRCGVGSTCVVLAVRGQRSKGLDDCKLASGVIWVCCGPSTVVRVACACCYTCMFQAPGSLLLLGVCL